MDHVVCDVVHLLLDGRAVAIITNDLRTKAAPKAYGFARIIMRGAADMRLEERRRVLGQAVVMPLLAVVHEGHHRIEKLSAYGCFQDGGRVMNSMLTFVHCVTGPVVSLVASPSRKAVESDVFTSCVRTHVRLCWQNRTFDGGVSERAISHESVMIYTDCCIDRAKVNPQILLCSILTAIIHLGVDLPTSRYLRRMIYLRNILMFGGSKVTLRIYR